MRCAIKLMKAPMGGVWVLKYNKLELLKLIVQFSKARVSFNDGIQKNKTAPVRDIFAPVRAKCDTCPSPWRVTAPVTLNLLDVSFELDH